MKSFMSNNFGPKLDFFIKCDAVVGIPCCRIQDLNVIFDKLFQTAYSPFSKCVSFEIFLIACIESVKSPICIRENANLQMKLMHTIRVATYNFKLVTISVSLF